MKDNYQTDFYGYIREAGCLLFSIVKAATDAVKKEISRSDLLQLINELHYRIKADYSTITPAISNEDNLKREGVFVWNHEAVFNETFKVLSSPLRARYTGRIYMPWEEARGRKSFGERVGDVLILQIRTLRTGHFRLPNWDPWEPGTTMRDLKSLRFYRLK